jgi:hypothetical protein
MKPPLQLVQQQQQLLSRVRTAVFGTLPLPGKQAKSPNYKLHFATHGFCKVFSFVESALL